MALILCHSLETVALTKRQEQEVVDLKMLRFTLGVTRMAKIRNEMIRGTAQVKQRGDKSQRGQTATVWTCPEEGRWVYW